ncbi:tautomerase family protein [Streptomyces albus]|uniref:tautomerase family protein n=1 Tax=Streptomyces albus TaxID=1888 RepID=UPI0004C671C5|nr:tautomerase family protein [Streptomyces albus]
MPGSEVEHGYPRLETVRAAVTALHRAVPSVRSFTASVLPVEVGFSEEEDLRAGVERVAGVMVRHLGLPEAPVVVAFREMADAANVELAAGPEYDVELNARFGRHRRDIGAALAHEITHVFLHRLGLSFPATDDNEILTDTAAAYLGVGWLLLDAFRQDALTSQKLGYLTPEEYGYVLAKRALLFGEDPAPWFTSPQAYTAYGEGLARARADERQPPLSGASRFARLRYGRARRAAAEPGAAPPPSLPDAPYSFDPGPPLRVTFPCPVCCQRLRVPVRGPVRVRCGLCGSVLDCDT